MSRPLNAECSCPSDARHDQCPVHCIRSRPHSWIIHEQLQGNDVRELLRECAKCRLELFPGALPSTKIRPDPTPNAPTRTDDGEIAQRVESELLDAAEGYLADLLTAWMADESRSEGQIHMEARATDLLNALRARKAAR